MPITRTTVETLYTFDELSDAAKEKAVEKLYDLNVDYDWWDFVYQDAATIGVEIEGFDIGYRNKIDGKLTESLLDCCKLIRKHHGKGCETFKTAAEYLDTYIQVFKVWLDAKTDDDKESWELEWSNKDWLAEFESEEEAEEVTNDFRKAILEDYLSMLRKEYDYKTSEEAIIESIQANEYMFTDDGSLA